MFSRPNSTLVINRYDSYCVNCGKGVANLTEKIHEKGCGILWTHVSSDYTGMKDRVTEMRPELIGVFPYDG